MQSLFIVDGASDKWILVHVETGGGLKKRGGIAACGKRGCCRSSGGEAVSAFGRNRARYGTESRLFYSFVPSSDGWRGPDVDESRKNDRGRS